MTKVNYSTYDLTTENINDCEWVAYPEEKDAIGFITEIKRGDSDIYVTIKWFDGGDTQHALSGIIDEGYIKGAVASSTIPNWAQ